MKKLSTLLAVLGMVLALAPAAQATIVAITNVTTSGSIDLDTFDVGAVTYTTATDVSLGTSVVTDSFGNAGVIGNQDNFDLSLYFGRGGNAADCCWNTSLFGGENWSDSNGSDADFFIFERGGNDTLKVAAIFPNDSVGQYVEIATNSSNWGDTGVDEGGQNIFGVAFAITDLKDAGGAALVNSTVIKGLAFDGPNTDIASVSAVPAPETDPAITLPTAPADGDTNVSIHVNLVASFDENIALTGSGTVTIRDLGPGPDVVIALPDLLQVTVSGAVLTINPTADLLEGNAYAVRISADAVEDLAANAFAGILNDTTWNFDTADAVAGVTVVDIGVDTHSPLIDLQFPLPGTSDWNTSLTLDASGNAYAVFVDSNMKNTVAKVTPGGVVTTQIIDTTNNDPDGHNTPSIAIDGDGFLHVAYNMHGSKFRPGMNMRKSPTANSVAGVWTDEGDQMPGSFTYPAMSTAPNGDVYLAIRNGTTGDPRPANLFHYDTSAGAWNDRGDFAQESGYTAYLPAPYVASDGKVHLVWHWAEGGPKGIRHLGSYAVYDPIEDTFSKADGTEYTTITNIPITTTTADAYQPREAAWSEKGISDHSLTVNALGQPIIAYNFFRVGDVDQRVLRLARWDGSAWQRTDLEGPETGTTLGDPVIVNRDGTLHIYFNDAGGKLTLRSSADNGLTFGDAITLTADAVRAAHVLIGGTSIGSRKEAIFFLDTSDNYAAKVMFVDYAQVGGPDDTAPAIRLDGHASEGSVLENEAIHTVVGPLSMVHADSWSVTNYSIIGGADDSSFTIDGTRLKTLEIFDSESQDTYVIDIQATDDGANTTNSVFTIAVSDVEEPWGGVYALATVKPGETEVATLQSLPGDNTNVAYSVLSGFNGDLFGITGAEQDVLSFTNASFAVLGSNYFVNVQALGTPNNEASSILIKVAVDNGAPRTGVILIIR